MTDLRTFNQIQPADIDAVGGKALSLALMAAASLPVPPGFCLTTAAHRRLRGQPLSTCERLAAAGGRTLAGAPWGRAGTAVPARVPPARWHLDRDAAKIIDRPTAAKTGHPAWHSEDPGPADKQTRPCLSETQLRAL